MKFSNIAAAAALLSAVSAFPLGISSLMKRDNSTKPTNDTLTTTSEDHFIAQYAKPYAIFQPKVLITSMFEPEADIWLQNLDFVHNLTLPGLSPVYPDLHCTTNYSICQVTTGESEINAAATIASLSLNPLFDFSKTYVLIAGIAGGEPNYTTTGSVTFSKYAVQVALEYQIDSKELGPAQANWTTGYFAFGTDNQQEYPENAYGSEVFELNENLRNRAVELAKTATLNNGTNSTIAFRKLYNETKARGLPAIEKCDVVTSDTYFTGNIMGDYFDSFVKLMSNGSATYCSTAQEDNASLEAFVRADKFGLVDYSRIVVMRTISDFARPPPSLDAFDFFTTADQAGFDASIENIYNAGLPYVTDILKNWESDYKNGTKYAPTNYIGDIFGTLGGTPDFGRSDFIIA